MTIDASPADDPARRRLAIGFLNAAHGLDHFVILIYPTVVIELSVAYGRSYADLIALSTASFIAFGFFSLPAGWLADRWSRRNMMVAFYLGCGLSLDRRGVRADVGDARGRAVCTWRVCRDLSSGRHRDGARGSDPARPHARLQRRLRQCRRRARRRRHRRAHRRVVLARRVSGAGARVHRDRRGLSAVRSAGGAAQDGAQRLSRSGVIRDRGDADLRSVRGGRAVRRARLQHALGRAAEDRRRARRAAASRCWPSAA